MIIGTGIDIIEIERVRMMHERFGPRFHDRVFLQGEIEYCLRQADPAPHLAARFAAKEAISKALGTGIGAQLSWHDMEVQREVSGRPMAILHGKGTSLLQKLGGMEIQLSLSHTRGQAAAMAVLVG